MNSYQALKAQGLRAEATPYPIPQMNAEGKLVCRYQHVNWYCHNAPQLEWIEVPAGTFPRYMDSPGLQSNKPLLTLEENRQRILNDPRSPPRLRGNLLPSANVVKTQTPLEKDWEESNRIHLINLEYCRVQRELEEKSKKALTKQKTSVNSVVERFIFAILATSLFTSLTERIDSEGRPIPRRIYFFLFRAFTLLYLLCCPYELWFYFQQHTIMNALTSLFFSPIFSLYSIITAPIHRAMYAIYAAISNFVLNIFVPTLVLCGFFYGLYHLARYIFFGMRYQAPFYRRLRAHLSDKWRRNKRTVMAELYDFYPHRRIFAFLILPLAYFICEFMFGHVWRIYLIALTLAFCVNHDWLGFAERVCSTAGDPDAIATTQALLDANNSRLRDAAAPRDPKLKYWSPTNPWNTDIWRDEYKPPVTPDNNEFTNNNSTNDSTTTKDKDDNQDYLHYSASHRASIATAQAKNKNLLQPRPLSGTLRNTPKEPLWGAMRKNIIVAPKPTPRIPGSEWDNFDGSNSFNNEQFPRPYGVGSKQDRWFS